MGWIVLLVGFAVIFGLASVFFETWRAFRDKKRSVATAIAITCIVAGVPTVFIATYFERQKLPALQQIFQVAGMALMFGAGISGAIGLAWDRTIAKHQSEAGAGDHAKKRDGDRAS